MKFKEIEFKYKADNTSLVKFQKYCESLGDYEFILASGYDHFYDSKNSNDAFCRYRVGPDMNQLTFKRKTTDVNNFIRTEHNIDLADNVNKDQVDALLAEFKYTHNSSIFKSCLVYRYPQHTFVYYTCYDLNMNELGRFLEIEVAEDYPWKDEEQAWDALRALEGQLTERGFVSPQARIKRSLFEMFRK